jgi:hypothetical protein
MLFPLLLRERLGERLFPWTRGEAAAAAMELQQREWKPIIGGVLKAMILPASLTIVTLSFIDRVGFGAILAVRPVVFVQSLGWATTEYAQLLAIYGLMNAVGAVLVGATFAAQAAIKRTAQHQREMLPPLKVAG